MHPAAGALFALGFGNTDGQTGEVGALGNLGTFHSSGPVYSGNDADLSKIQSFASGFQFVAALQGHMGFQSLTDPLFSAGYTEYMKTELTTANVMGFASDCFWNDPAIVNVVLENKIGEGIVTFVTSKDYPGNTALYPLYNALVREFIAASARNCDVKVIASDKLRYAVYEGNKIYLLNTDYDLPITVKLIVNGTEKLVTLDSLELKTINF